MYSWARIGDGMASWKGGHPGWFWLMVRGNGKGKYDVLDTYTRFEQKQHLTIHSQPNLSNSHAFHIFTSIQKMQIKLWSSEFWCWVQESTIICQYFAGLWSVCTSFESLLIRLFSSVTDILPTKGEVTIFRDSRMDDWLLNLCKNVYYLILVVNINIWFIFPIEKVYLYFV